MDQRQLYDPLSTAASRRVEAKRIAPKETLHSASVSQPINMGKRKKLARTALLLKAGP